MASLLFPLLLLFLGEEQGVLRSPGIIVLKWPSVWFDLWHDVYELDGEIGGQCAIILDIGKEFGCFLLL